MRDLHAWPQTCPLAVVAVTAACAASRLCAFLVRPLPFSLALICTVVYSSLPASPIQRSDILMSTNAGVVVSSEPFS